MLLTDTGELSTISEGGSTRDRINLPESVADICKQDGHVVAVTCKGGKCKTWTLLRWADGSWATVGTARSARDRLVALDCASDRLTLVTTRRLIDFPGGVASPVGLSRELGEWTIASVHVTRDHVFVGINAGEWGGGLVRIDRRSGKVTTIEKNATGELCAGPLNTECDPVNGIASEPWKPDCVAAAIGLVHFSPHGRIVEVCGDSVQRLYFKPYGAQPASSWEKDGEPFKTVAFFGLTRVGDSLYAAGIDGLYRIDEGGSVEFSKLPEFKNVGGIHVSFELPNVVLVYTSVNWRRSISGSVPMLAPR